MSQKHQGIDAVHKPQITQGFGLYGGPPEPFHIAYERKRMPDFGALEYAYIGLALPDQPIMGAGVAVAHQGVNITQAEQAYVLQSVPTNTLWLSAGAMYNQPLTEDGNFIEQVPNVGTPPSVFRNVPATHWVDAELWNNNPFPDRRL